MTRLDVDAEQRLQVSLPSAFALEFRLFSFNVLPTRLLIFF